MKRFLTLFPETENFHLTKDVGMIPFVLHKELGYQSTIACYKNGSYPYLQTEVEGLKLVFIKKVFGNRLFDGLLFLLLNFKMYDIVQTYHLRKESFIWLYVFRLLTSSKGKTYLKLDEGVYLKDSTYNSFRGKISLYFIRKIDLLSIETKSICAYLNESNLLGRKIEYIPNGFYDWGKKGMEDFGEKKNIMLTVGRIGTEQKATEILCEAFAKFGESNKDWILEIIGPIKNDFSGYITTFFNKYPLLKDRVIFYGEIADRKVLKDKFRAAKIFTLSSRWEGFALVYLEAVQSGCYSILTDIPPAHDVTDEGKYGQLVPVDDIEGFARAMTYSTDNVGFSSLSKEIQAFGYANFYWPEIVRKIDNLLNSL